MKLENSISEYPTYNLKSLYVEKIPENMLKKEGGMSRKDK
jgi:hypothetical protein